MNRALSRRLERLESAGFDAEVFAAAVRQWFAEGDCDGPKRLRTAVQDFVAAVEQHFVAQDKEAERVLGLNNHA